MYQLRLFESGQLCTILKMASFEKLYYIEIEPAQPWTLVTLELDLDDT